MKKTFVTIIALSISFLTLAQNSDDSQSSGDLENQFYFRFGYSHPTKHWFGVEDAHLEIWDHTTRFGSTFEIGQIFMINSLPLADGLRIGINVDYGEFSFHSMTYDYNHYEVTGALFKMSAKVGPSLSYSPVADLVFDAFFKLKITPIAIYADDLENLDYIYLGTGGFGIAAGFNVRWRFLMAGLEFNTEKIKLEDVDDPGYYVGAISDPDVHKTPLPSFSFTFGFSF